MDLQGLSVICNGLGIALDDDDGNRIGYRKHKYCLDNLKDLLRFLRRDDPQNRDVFKEVCKWNIVSKDLIPIIEHCQEDRSLVLNAVKVLVFLTMPVEPTSSDILQQIEFLVTKTSVLVNSETFKSLSLFWALSLKPRFLSISFSDTPGTNVSDFSCFRDLFIELIILFIFAQFLNDKDVTLSLSLSLSLTCK